jgi:hypothetical protein
LLTLRAGPHARQLIRERGLRVEDVDVLVGASGGAKWLVLGGLDRYLFGEFLPSRVAPLPAIGSSIGSWRIACLGQRDPLAALERGHHGYIYLQRYPRRPTAAQVTAVLQQALDILLGATGVDEIMGHPWLRPHVITARGRGLLASSWQPLLSVGLVLTAALNAIHRRALGITFERTIFRPSAAPASFARAADVATSFVDLTPENLRAALLASGSIPLLCEGVSVPGADGVHWDGGIVDYHPHLDWDAGTGLVLYPHFYPHLVPGWFDRRLPWRHGRGSWLDRVLLIAPSSRFVAALPNAKIPDRSDFLQLSDAARVAAWQGALDASARLGDELRDLVVRQRVADRLEPL